MPPVTSLDPDGPSALKVLQGGEQIDLLFADIVMPRGMNGGALAEAARRLHPGRPDLFTSGHFEPGIAREAGLEPAGPLLSKRYQEQELAKRIRELLRPTMAAHEGP